MKFNPTKIVSAVVLWTGMVGFCGTKANAAYYAWFLTLRDGQFLDGKVETRIQTNMPDPKVIYYLIPSSGGERQVVGVSTQPPYYYIQWGTSRFPPGIYYFGAQVIGKSVSTDVLEISVYLSVPSAQCPATTLEIRNGDSIILYGITRGSNIGGDRWYIEPQSIDRRRVYVSVRDNHASAYTIAVEVHDQPYDYAVTAITTVLQNNSRKVRRQTLQCPLLAGLATPVLWFVARKSGRLGGRFGAAPVWVFAIL